MENTQHQQQQPLPQQQAPQQTHAPVTTSSGSLSQPPVITTPAWIVAIRAFQFVLAIIILGLSGAIIHWVYMDELGLSLAMSLFTWIIVLYALLTEKIVNFRKAYQLYAVLALDLFMCILWLSTMGATAARRATFVVPVTASCSSDGSAVNSGRCTVFKRYIVMGKGALAMLAAIAGLSALQLILFIVTFVWTLVVFLKWRKTGAPAASAAASSGEIQLESKQQLYSPSVDTTVNQQQQYQQNQQQYQQPQPQHQQHQQQQEQQYQQYQQHEHQHQQQQQPPYTTQTTQHYQESSSPAQQQFQQQHTGGGGGEYTQVYHSSPPPQQQQHHQYTSTQQFTSHHYHPSPVSGSPPPTQGQDFNKPPPQELR
ncbi:uncharacterized protein CTRU02_210267 [Colletotrichum truncatum]|uniref:Uncharacterized protein n=1 Tax=Colletotrichum truncatum TaxID=5467 RepID=A0ACC3YUS1_COLTU|nr:uncharacterized protein CTRU02_11478 [Colletotrichum truncatum]KAF6785852.1 hypothetical protein CTRU02_11478 [Colletotrichum truncatum]